jgi:hypothetical protein
MVTVNDVTIKLKLDVRPLFKQVVGLLIAEGFSVNEIERMVRDTAAETPRPEMAEVPPWRREDQPMPQFSFGSMEASMARHPSNSAIRMEDVPRSQEERMAAAFEKRGLEPPSNVQVGACSTMCVFEDGVEIEHKPLVQVTDSSIDPQAEGTLPHEYRRFVNKEHAYKVVPDAE